MYISVCIKVKGDLSFCLCANCDFSAACGPIWLILWLKVVLGHINLAARWRPYQPPGGASKIAVSQSIVSERGSVSAQNDEQLFIGHPYYEFQWLEFVAAGLQWDGDCSDCGTI